MERTITAIYEDGLLRPLQTLDLPEHQSVQVKIVWRKKPARPQWTHTEYTRALRVLKQAGLLAETTPSRSRRRVSAKRRRELARALSAGEPLSAIIIAERSDFSFGGCAVSSNCSRRRASH